MSMQAHAQRAHAGRTPIRPRRERHRVLRRESTILLVEDDDEMRRLLATALRRDGHRVVEAKDGEEALDWLGLCLFDGSLERIPSLIVSDIRLPNFTGIELLEGLLCASEAIPTILITGFPDARIRADAEELGAECVIEKPFDLDELRAAVRSAVHPGEETPDRSA